MISLLLFLAAGRFNAFMDMFKDQWNDSVFQDIALDNWLYRWAAAKSSLNKWKTIKNDKGKWVTVKRLPGWKNNPWYYLWLYRPKFIEKFVFSSTFLVFITDGWHFYQFMWWLSVTIATMSHSLPFYTEIEYFWFQIPNLFAWLLNLVGLGSWYANHIYLVYNTNAFLLLTFARMIGFTAWYDYFLRANKWSKKLYKKITFQN